MPPRIVLCYPVETRHIERIAAAMPGAEIVDAGQERIASELLGGGYLLRPRQGPGGLGRSGAPGPAAVDPIVGGGNGSLPGPAVVASDIAVTSASGVLADQVAEHAMH